MVFLIVCGHIVDPLLSRSRCARKEGFRSLIDVASDANDAMTRGRTTFIAARSGSKGNHDRTIRNSPIFRHFLFILCSYDFAFSRA